MAKSKKEQQAQAAQANVSDAQKAEILAAAQLNADLRAQAEQYGAYIGKYSSIRVEWQEAMQASALALMGLGHEKYVGNITPAQEAYLSAVIAGAWSVTFPGVTLKISDDRTLANFQSQARNICKAASLSGWVKNEKGDTLNTRETLETMLGKRFTHATTDSKGFHAAAAAAYRFIVLAQKQVERGDLKLSQVSVGALTKKDKTKGRPKAAMSTERVDQFLDKLGLSAPTDVVRVIESAVQTLAASIPLTATDPKAKAACHAAHDWIMREGKAYAERARKVMREALASMVSPAKQGEKQAGADVASLAKVDAAALKAGKVGPMQTPATPHKPTMDAEHRIVHTDEVTSKRKGKATRKAGKPAAIRESMPMQQTA